MGLDPALDTWRLPPSERCWWCGDLATTEEHRIKHSTLRRVARTDSGKVDPANTFKKAEDFEGPLRSLKKGAQVKWRKNMCANCNNARSQPFDLAYDTMEQFIVEHADEMGRWPQLAWTDVYGANWEPGAANLGRYFAKQMCCMLATQRLPIPGDLLEFLDGALRCPSVTFMIYRNWRAIDAHRMFRSGGQDEGITTFVGLLPTNAYHQDGQFSGVDYGYHIGYVWFLANWTQGSDRTAWWEHPVIDVPLLNADPVSKVQWRTLRLRSWIVRLPGRLKETTRTSRSTRQ